MARGGTGDYLYDLVMSTGDYDDDTKPYSDPDMVKRWVELKKIVSDYRAKRDKTASVERIADLKSRLEYIKSGRDTIAKLEETRGKDRRVSAQVYKDMQTAIMKMRTDLANKSNQYQSRLFNQAEAQFRSAGGGDPGARAASEALLNTLTAEGVGYNPQDPSVAGLAQQYSTMVFGKPVTELSEQEVVERLKAGNASREIQQGIVEFIRNGKQATAAARGAQAVLDEQQRRINSIGVGPDGEVKGEGFDQLLDATKKAQAAFESLAGRDTGQLSAEIERLAADDSEYRKLIEDEQMLKERVFNPGAAGLRTRMGRFLSDPDVQAWADAYGYKVGIAKVDANGKVTYVPGADDEKVLMRYAYQTKHPDRFGRLFKNQGATRDLVRITATDPKQQEELLKANDLGGGRYALDESGTVVPPEKYTEKQRMDGYLPSGYQMAKDPATKKLYIKSDSGAYYEYDKATKTFGSELSAGQVPAKLTFEDAAIFAPGKDGKVVRYLTGSDIANGIAGFALGSADESEAQQIQSQTPKTFKIVSADQLPAGKATFVGYLDKPNAGMMARYGSGAVSINNGEHIFTKGVTVEVLQKDAETRSKSFLARKAEREAAKLGGEGQLTEAQRLSLRPEEPAPVARPPVQPTELAYQAAADPVNPDNRLEMLVDQNLITPAQAAEARRQVQEAQDELRAGKTPTTPAPPPFEGEGGYKYRFNADNTVDLVGGPDSKATEQAPIRLKPDVAAKVVAERETAKKAKAVEPVFVKTKEGAIYEMGPSYAKMISPAPNQPLDTTPLSVGYRADEFEALKQKFVAEKPSIITKEEAEKTKPPRPAEFEAPEEPAKPKVTTKAGSTYVEYGKTRPTLREKAKSMLGGLFAKKKEEALPAPSAEAAKALEEADTAKKAAPPAKKPQSERWREEFTPEVQRIIEEPTPAPAGTKPAAAGQSASVAPVGGKLSTFKKFQAEAKKKPNLAAPETTETPAARTA